MKRKAIIVAFLAIYFGMIFPGAVFPQEETGAVIRQLVQKVHDDMNNMESELVALSSEKESLTSELKSLSKHLEKSSSSKEEEQLAAEMGLLLAKLNKIDRNSVSVVKTNINKLRPSMKALKAEYEKVAKMGHASWGEFEQWRNEMGNMLQNSANLLKQLRTSLRTASSESEIANAENTLLLMYGYLQISNDQNLDSGALINKQMQILNDAYSQMHIIDSLLEQERFQLKLLTYSEIIQLVTDYFSGDEFSMVLDAPDFIRKGVHEREMFRSQLNERSQKRISGDQSINNSADRESQLEQLRSGAFNWNNPDGN